MKFSPGSRWKSAVCETEAIVVRPPAGDSVLECGGRAMLPYASPKASGLSPSTDSAAGSLLGKRYVDEIGGLEVLCTKAGAGSMAFDGRVLIVKEAKRLPSSD